MNNVGLPAGGGPGTSGSSATSSTSATPGSAALQGASLAFQKKRQQQQQQHQPTAPASAHRGYNGGGHNGGGGNGHLGAGNVGENGALVAATLSAQSTGGSATGLPDMDSPHARSIVAARLQQWGHGSAAQHHLHPPGHQQHGGGKLDTKSPSFIAATLAASRSASPNPNPHPASSAATTTTPRRKHSVGTASILSTPDAVDSESIPPTGSLISMFEQVRGAPVQSPGDPVKRASPKRNSIDVRLREERQQLSPVKLPMDTPEKPPKPTKPVTVAAKPRPSTPPPKPSVVSTSQPVVLSPKPTRPSVPPQITPSATGPAATSSRTDQESTPGHARKKSDVKPAKPAKPTQPIPPVQSKQPTAQPAQPAQAAPSAKSAQPAQSAQKAKPAQPAQSIQKTKPVEPTPPVKPARQAATAAAAAPTPPKPRGTNKAGRAQAVASPKPMLEEPLPFDTHLHRTMTNESIDNFVSAPTSPEHSPPPSRPVLPVRKQITASAPSSPTRVTPRPYRMKTPSSQTLNVNALSNAIVAGSLASSRLTPSNTGSSQQPPPLPTRQRSPRLKQTLRQAPHESDDSDDQHKKKHRHKLRSGKHAHHEGSRKKWRDEIRERERKRYEAVWASNRGLLLPATSLRLPDIGGNGNGIREKDLASCVANVVVRDIWRRSRLPEDELGEVWDLVDRDKRGLLDKQEFVVGMWLIDQRLKGRKIPAKVSDSVWGSVNGLRVMRPKR